MKKRRPNTPSGIAQGEHGSSDLPRLSAQVRDLRKMSGLTQEEAAKRSGVGLRFVREVEQGKERVRVDKVNQVLALFGYHLEAVKTDETSA